MGPLRHVEHRAHLRGHRRRVAVPRRV